MSTFINVGAIDSKGNRVKTKKQLREIVQNAVETEQDDLVMFDQTAFMQSGHIPGNATLADLPEGVKLSVVGPDPYTTRNWYATVERKGDKVKVS
jgi:hypothetical protein